MSGWIRTRINFPCGAMIYRITYHDRFNQSLEELLSVCDASDNPSIIEPLLRKVVLDARPELEGCSILSMEFVISSREWQVLVMHPSIPVVGMYAEYPKERLFREQPNAVS